MASELFELPPIVAIEYNTDKLLGRDEEKEKQLIESLKKDHKSLKEDLQHLEDWYAKQPHLPADPHIKTLLLKVFLTCDFKLEKTKTKVDNFFTLRGKFPDILQNRDPLGSDVARELRYPHIVVCPKMTSENHRVILFRLDGPRNFSALDVAKISFMISDYRLYNDTSAGDHWVYDCKHNSMSNFMGLSAILAKLAFVSSNAYSSKVKGIHCLNVHGFAESLINMYKKLVKKKIADRIHVHGSIDDLYKLLPKSIFPSDYGGDEPSCREIIGTWADTFESKEVRDWFIAQDKLCADESKRLGTSQFNDSELFGVDGSFKALAID